jgi:tryptophan synthase alpha chain
LPPEIIDNVKKIKRSTKKPVCVGFGVSSPAQARSIVKIADGVIVGSAVIRVIEKNIGKPDMPKALAERGRAVLERARAMFPDPRCLIGVNPRELEDVRYEIGEILDRLAK